ncbi:MAG: 3-deoxy-manno-octulosonate cytidylyltransferase [Candidatus Hydrogenedentes bacterium]|nr:3-deoxy-manno-octulosonate cytidylyltransferase [Candidatus Hydrogenedentota bacterium]
MAKTRITGIIPARYGSTRLPGKPLRAILDKSMIQHVYERCAMADSIDDLVVATDDERIRDAVLAFGGKAVMTRPDHPSGTDRLAEVAESLETDIVVNIQGDQPFFNPDMIDEVVTPLVADPALEVATLMYPIEREDDLHDTGVVKVVTNLLGDALYFSRSLIPFPRQHVAHKVFEHVGLYAYRRTSLLRLAKLPVTTLEAVESLEQLRWLEHGVRIRVVESQCADQAFSGFSVDTPEDLARAEAMLREHLQNG